MGQMSGCPCEEIGLERTNYAASDGVEGSSRMLYYFSGPSRGVEPTGAFRSRLVGSEIDLKTTRRRPRLCFQAIYAFSDERSLQNASRE
jgi:hypothetical protein